MWSFCINLYNRTYEGCWSICECTAWQVQGLQGHATTQASWLHMLYNNQLAFIRGACIQVPATFKDTHFTFYVLINWTTSLLQILICWRIAGRIQNSAETGTEIDLTIGKSYRCNLISGDKQVCCLLHNIQEHQLIHWIFQIIKVIP